MDCKQYRLVYLNILLIKLTVLSYTTAINKLRNYTNFQNIFTSKEIQEDFTISF